MSDITIKCPDKNCGATLHVFKRDSRKEHTCPVCKETQVFKLFGPLKLRPPKTYYKPPKGWDKKHQVA